VAQHDRRLDPVIYVLEGQLSLVTSGWDWAQLGNSQLAIGIVGMASITMCFAALR
jgi:hypothetical protein